MSAASTTCKLACQHSLFVTSASCAADPFAGQHQHGTPCLVQDRVLHAQVDVLSRTTPAADRWYLAGIAAIALAVSGLGLTYVPQRLLDFNVTIAAEDAGKGLSMLMAQRIPGLVRSALLPTLPA